MKEELEKPEFVGIEKELYPYVESFFRDKLNLETIDYDTSNTLSVKLFGSGVRPDVYGINEDEKNKLVVMAEGKWDFFGRNFDICKGQGVALQRFADKVYLFLSKEGWDGLNKKDQKQILSELTNWGLGLLVIDPQTSECEELLKPTDENKLLEVEWKKEVFYEISEKFPKFDDEDFLRFCAPTAKKTCESCFWVIDLLKSLSFFRKGRTQIAIRPENYYGFNLNFRRQYKPNKFTPKLSYLDVSIYPLGDEISNKTSFQPTLIILFTNDDVREYLKSENFKKKLKDLLLKSHSAIKTWRKRGRVWEIIHDFYEIENKKENNDKIEEILSNKDVLSLQLAFYVEPIVGEHIDNIQKITESKLVEIKQLFMLK